MAAGEAEAGGMHFPDLTMGSKSVISPDQSQLLTRSNRPSALSVLVLLNQSTAPLCYRLGTKAVSLVQVLDEVGTRVRNSSAQAGSAEEEVQVPISLPSCMAGICLWLARNVHQGPKYSERATGF